jgi:hypothetical protein
MSCDAIVVGRRPQPARRGRARLDRPRVHMPLLRAPQATPRSPAMAAQISARARSTGIAGSSDSARMP